MDLNINTETGVTSIVQYSHEGTGHIVNIPIEVTIQHGNWNFTPPAKSDNNEIQLPGINVQQGSLNNGAT